MTLYISGKGGIEDSISQPSGSAHKESYEKQQNQKINIKIMNLMMMKMKIMAKLTMEMMTIVNRIS